MKAIPIGSGDHTVGESIFIEIPEVSSLKSAGSTARHTWDSKLFHFLFVFGKFTGTAWLAEFTGDVAFFDTAAEITGKYFIRKIFFGIHQNYFDTVFTVSLLKFQMFLHAGFFIGSLAFIQPFFSDDIDRFKFKISWWAEKNFFQHTGSIIYISFHNRHILSSSI